MSSKGLIIRHSVSAVLSYRVQNDVFVISNLKINSNKKIQNHSLSFHQFNHRL